MKKLSVFFATLMIVALSVVSCKKACTTPVKESNDSVQVDSTETVDSAVAMINK